MLMLAARYAPAGATAQASQAVTPIARVTWLAGCLEMRSASRVVEEQRMAERGGTMLGMGRTVTFAAP
jgi:hypothetical protein